LRTKEEGTHLTLNERDDDDENIYDVSVLQGCDIALLDIGSRHFETK